MKKTTEELLKEKMLPLSDLNIYPLKLKEILYIEGTKQITLVVKEPDAYSDYMRYEDEFHLNDNNSKIVKRCDDGYSIIDSEVSKLISEFRRFGYFFYVSSGLFVTGVLYFVQKYLN